MDSVGCQCLPVLGARSINEERVHSNESSKASKEREGKRELGDPGV